jgi:hypothetical protein
MKKADDTVGRYVVGEHTKTRHDGGGVAATGDWNSYIIASTPETLCVPSDTYSGREGTK